MEPALGSRVFLLGRGKNDTFVQRLDFVATIFPVNVDAKKDLLYQNLGWYWCLYTEVGKGEEFSILTPPMFRSVRSVVPLWESAFSKFCISTLAAEAEDTAPRKESRKTEIEECIL